MVSLPAEPGVYALVMRLPRWTAFRAGALGMCVLPQGWYVYLGSARGPGGLRARVGRHLRRAGKRAHWHMDHLRPHVRIHAVWWTPAAEMHETDWVQAAATLPGARPGPPGFGAGDSPHPTHLFGFSRRPDVSRFQRLAGPVDSVTVPQDLR